MPLRFGRYAVRLLLLSAIGAAGCAKAPQGSRPTASSSGATSASPPRPAQRPGAAELYRQADVELASVRSDDVDELVSYLENPNPYLRAGALALLTPHAARLSTPALRRVVERLTDPDPIVAKRCLPYESSRRAYMGQGMMLSAAECAYNNRITISGLAATVLARAEPNSLANASVLALAAEANLTSMLDPLVREREAELRAPLERALVSAEKSARGQEMAAAVILLANGSIGTGAPDTLDALARIAGGGEDLRSLRALCVLLTLSYPGAGIELSESANRGYSRLRASIRGSCTPGDSCAAPLEVMHAVRGMRAAAAPLLPELLSVLDADEESLRTSALMVMASMGEAARPAIPKIRALLARKAAPDDVDGFALRYLLDVVGAARPSPASVTPAIMIAVRRYPGLYDQAAAVLVTLEARLQPSQRAVLLRGYDDACADAGSIANFSYSRDERCFLASENLKKLKVLRAEAR